MAKYRIILYNLQDRESVAVRVAPIDFPTYRQAEKAALTWIGLGPWIKRRSGVWSNWDAVLSVREVIDTSEILGVEDGIRETKDSIGE